jgi:uncharacterized protein YcbK (DUF882 family)
MMKLAPGSALVKVVLLALAAWVFLTLTNSEMSQKDDLSGRRVTDSRPPPARKAAKARSSDRQDILGRLAADLSGLMRRLTAPEPAEPGIRRLRLYNVHTGESLSIIYRRNGRYIPSALAQLDYFLRDWRTNTVVSMSVETLDLLWELHQELGSKQPINVICGFRSAQTNALLKRIGRHVAAESEHVRGRAIDVQFPDVPLKLLRDRALVHEAGGVGYYPAGSGGFVHIDSGRVRHWPGMSRAELAQVFSESTGTVEAGRQQRVLGVETAPAEQQKTSVPPPLVVRGSEVGRSSVGKSRYKVSGGTRSRPNSPGPRSSQRGQGA